MLVSGSYFQTLGVRAEIGRLFGPEYDAHIGEPHSVVLSYSFWQTRLGGDKDILSRTMMVNGQSMTVIGVAERGFEGNIFYLKPPIFVPITMRGFMEPQFAGFRVRHVYWTYLFAAIP